MLNSDKLEFERGAAAKTKTKTDTMTERIATMTVTVRGRPVKITSLSQPCGDFVQGQGLHWPEGQCPCHVTDRTIRIYPF
jgi:hypothetical protein